MFDFADELEEPIAECDDTMFEEFEELWYLLCDADNHTFVAALHAHGFDNSNSVFGPNGETLLHAAVYAFSPNRHHLQNIQSLIDCGHPVDDPDFDDATPLSFACSFGKAVCCEMLLAAGADPDARHGDNYTPSYIARRNRSSGCIASIARHRRRQMQSCAPGPAAWVVGWCGLPGAVAESIMEWAVGCRGG